MSKKIGEYSEGHLLGVAKDVVLKKTKDSTILDVKAEDRIPKFELKELKIGRVLGRGGFCVVSEITQITLLKGDTPQSNGNRSEDEHYIHNIVQDRAFMAQHCIRQGKDFRYAVKRVQETSRNDPQTFINAVVDLAVESRFLAVVRHPNIIKMRAMDFHSPFESSFFVVLDKLYDIMPVRLKKWKKQEGAGLMKMMKSKKAKQAFWVERLTFAYDIACALSYLHGLSVIYRDLKPDNIGFDVRGDIKIFDFGLAKELDPKNMLEDGTYNLTAETGSLRYMAPGKDKKKSLSEDVFGHVAETTIIVKLMRSLIQPFRCLLLPKEIARGKPYNETVDTFSFSILCWEMLAIETPYAGFTVKMFHKSVIEGGARPKIKDEWGPSICTFLRQSFVDNPKRPSMTDTCEVFRDEINKLSDDEIVDILDASRKSQLSL